MSDLGDGFSAGESVAYIYVIGDTKTGTVKRQFVEYLFGKLGCKIQTPCQY